MASFDTLQKLADHPEWLPPRSDVRAFLGEPGGPEAAKTTVEPGNVFSPGMRTCGVTWWLRFPENGAFFATENAPLDELHWSCYAEHLPIYICTANVHGILVEHILFQDGSAQSRTEAACAQLVLANTLAAPVRVQLVLALRSLGPAGGPLPNLALADGRRALQRRDGAVLLAVDRTPDAAGCGVGDPFVAARYGLTPAAPEAEDVEGWCFGLLRYDLVLDPGVTWAVHLDCPLPTNGTLARDYPSCATPQPAAFAARLAAHAAVWRSRFGEVAVNVPDTDFRRAFFAGPAHMLTAMVGDQARIAALSYPLPWLRDSIYIIRCFDLLGLHTTARAALSYVTRHDFFGGFGAEGDAPGQGIWALVQHYRLTGDRAWLAGIYPAVRRKVDWLLRMRRTAEPLQVFVDTPTLAFSHGHRASGVICLPARNGLIEGSMDHGIGHARGWVNQWAICGLREAAHAAAALGETADAAAWTAEADDLTAALHTFAAADSTFWSHERTVNSMLWPTNAWAGFEAQVAAPFDRWWNSQRGDGGAFQPEPYWLYFESAQAHNALLLGNRERAWTTVDYRLRHQDLPGLYGWREGGDGVGTENATQGVTLIPLLRGCHKFSCITPHGWSQAEMWLLQRALLVEEWRDGLLLFAGAPLHWLEPGKELGFSNLPTLCGVVSATLVVASGGRSARISVRGARGGTPLTVRLPWGESTTLAKDGETIISL